MSMMPAGRMQPGVGAMVVLLLAAGSLPARAGEDARVFGPLQETAVIEDFGAEGSQAWKPRAGDNVIFTLRPGVEPPGGGAALAIDLGHRDPGDHDATRNWFAIEREDLPADAVPADLDGFRFLLGARTDSRWWISVDLAMEGGEIFSRVIANHAWPAGRLIEYAIDLEEFKTKAGQALSRQQARALRGITFVCSTPETTLYLDRVAAYRREPQDAWLDFTTSHPDTNLFQRTDPVEITFAPGGALPPDAVGFRYEIRDFFGERVAGDTVRFTGATTYTLDATPATHGYYEAQAFFVDGDGRDLSRHSRIRAEGTVPAGLGTFSVVPATVEENIARFRRLGAEAFFGIHGDFHRLGDHVGLAWRFGYRKWPWLEPERPDRSAGMAPWARDLLQEAPLPEYRRHILPFRGNMGEEVPAWARREGEGAPPFQNWDDYLAMVRDYVRVEKRLYPHQKPRLYGGAWEVNCNMAPYVSQPPEHTAADVVELFRRFRQVVRAEDPDGLVIGPCPNVIDLDWFETMFQAGILEHLDGIETHGYHERGFDPETEDFPARITRLNELVRRHNQGRELPLYCTEAGQPGVLGAEVVHRSQAKRMARAAIILKGEGVRVFLPFYGIDYDREGYWGFLFNLEVDAPGGPWGTRRVSPKPMVNAMAACAQVLEGAQPRKRLRAFDDEVWLYLFERGDATITVVWTTGEARTIHLPVGRQGSVEVVNIMGRSSELPVEDGAVRLAIDDGPVYVVERDRR